MMTFNWRIMEARFSDILRFGVIVAGAFTLASVPPIPLAPATGPVVGIMVLFAFLAGFFINRALERKHTITRAVSVELSRLRRIHHLAENMTDKRWAARVDAALERYHVSLGNNFLAHEATQERFRDITHLIYNYKPKGAKDQLLLADLLATAKDVALERQQLEQALAHGISWYGYAIMMTIGAFAVFLMLLNRFETSFSPLTSGFVIAGVLLTLDLLVRTNALSPREILENQDQYRHNLSSH